jgi:esterase/lipase
MESLRKAFCLICHGLNSTPQSMHALRDFLNDMGIETKEVVLKGHSGDLSLMKDISALEWEKELLLAYQDVRQKADAAKIPFYYLGYSLGGLLNASIMQKHETVYYDKILLFAPALSLRITSELGQVFRLLAKEVMIPTFAPKDYRFHNKTSAGAYKALFEILSEVRGNKFKNLNCKTLIFIDPLDELVSYYGLKAIKNKYNFENWNIVPIKKDKSTARYKFRHLILDEPTLGKKTWDLVKEKIKDFL